MESYTLLSRYHEKPFDFAAADDTAAKRVTNGILFGGRPHYPDLTEERFKEGGGISLSAATSQRILLGQ